MNEFVQILIGLVVLVLGIPVGDGLAKVTKEELDEGQKWFKLLVLIGLVGGTVGLIIENDIILFTFFFIAIVSSRSIKPKKSKTSKKSN
ncbi:MAG: hypothetical protein ABEI74_02060 [Candidatus Pacearchaeota archaeon]